MQKIYAKVALGLLVAAFCYLPSLSLAQETPPPLAEMWIAIPKTGHAQELAQALGEHKAFRSEHGDPWEWNVYTPFLGDDLDRFAIRSCCHAWADVDAYREWSENNAEVAAHFDEHVAPLVEKYEHYFEEIDWANSHWNREAGPYRYFAVTEFAVKAGHGAEFNAAREKMSQIAINQGWANEGRSWIWASVIGGSPMVAIVVPHTNFASMARDGESFMSFLEKQLGSAEAAAELQRQFSGSTTGSAYQIWVQKD